MSMTVQELIERLSELDPEATVRLATQPSWPLAFEMGGVATSQDIMDVDIDYNGVPEGPCPDHEVEACEECLAEMAGPSIVWLSSRSWAAAESTICAAFAIRGATTSSSHSASLGFRDADLGELDPRARPNRPDAEPSAERWHLHHP